MPKSTLPPAEVAALRAKTLSYLKKNVLAVLATCGDDRKPRASVVHYAIDNAFGVWFVTRRQTRKFQDLRDNANVGITVGLQPKPFTVQMVGTAKLAGPGMLEQFRELVWRRPKAFKAYFGNDFPRSPFQKMNGLDVVVFRVKLTEVQVMDFEAKKDKMRFRMFTP